MGILIYRHMGWDTALFAVEWESPQLSSVSEGYYSQLSAALRTGTYIAHSYYITHQEVSVFIYNDCLFLEVNFTNGQALVEELEVAVGPRRPLALLVLPAAHDE